MLSFCGQRLPLGFSSSISIQAVDYQSQASLATAFKGQDAIIEAFNPAAAEYQKKVVDAAIDAGVQQLITPDFSSDTFNEYAEGLIIFEPKIKAQKHLEMRAREGKLAWTAIVVGAFYDWGEFSVCARLFCSSKVDAPAQSNGRIDQ